MEEDLKCTFCHRKVHITIIEDGPCDCSTALAAREASGDGTVWCHDCWQKEVDLEERIRSNCFKVKRHGQTH